MWGRARQIGIAPLGGERAAECARIHATAFPYPWEVHDFERLIGARSAFGHAALDLRSRGLVGFILCRGAADEAELLTIAVDAGFRKQGVGRKLLATNMASLARHGLKHLFLEVEENNIAALKLYARFGFEDVGRRPNYYRTAGGPAAGAIVMRKEL